MLSSLIKQKIKSHALSNVAEEVCGLLVNNDVYSCQNINKDKINNFTLDPYDYLRYSLLGKIKGIYHSHAKREGFSLFDRLNSNQHNILSVLYVIEKDRFNIYDPNNETHRASNNYINRKFEIGKNDCFTLIKDYYFNELNIKLPDFVRGEKWEDEQPEIIDENWQKNGFVKIDIEEQIQPHDILCFGVRDSQYPAHLGVFLSNNKFLHHSKREKGSCIKDYVEQYKKITKYILRHVSLIKNEK